ncbi:hypothetical protein N9A62_02775 [Akkermansiaceae bacterium]|nr:hypothetical protein [Akkermansiaceae bacterium]
MKIPLCLLAAFVLLLNSCSESDSKEGPLGFKIGQTYELSYYEYEQTNVLNHDKQAQGFFPKPKKYYRAFVAKVVDVGPDWVEFQRRGTEKKFKMTAEEIQKKLINYKLQ